MIALSPTPVLETERLILRAPASKDWALWDAFQASDRADFIRTGTHDAQLTWRGWAAVIGHWVMRGWGPLVFTAKDNDRGMGLVGPWQPEGWPEAEILWNVWSPEHEGHGYVAEAARAMVDHAFRDLNWASAVSYIDPLNTRSIALAQRLGATLDRDAQGPRGKTCLVYRHKTPEVAA